MAPGESKRYLWYADKEYGSCILQSFGDMRNHRYHGLFGAIIIEPPGAKWYRSFSFAEAMHEEEAVITAPGIEEFRECVVMIQNGIRMLDREGKLVKTTEKVVEETNVRNVPGEGMIVGETMEEMHETEEQEVEAPDAEDTGEKGYNYRSERFANRLKKDNRISKIFSSRVHGDPGTPAFRASTRQR